MNNKQEGIFRVGLVIQALVMGIFYALSYLPVALLIYVVFGGLFLYYIKG